MSECRTRLAFARRFDGMRSERRKASAPDVYKCREDTEGITYMLTLVQMLFLVSVALLPDRLGLVADRLLRVAVEARCAMTPESSIPISNRDRYESDDSHSLANSS